MAKPFLQALGSTPLFYIEIIGLDTIFFLDLEALSSHNSSWLWLWRLALALALWLSLWLFNFFGSLAALWLSAALWLFT